MTLKLIFLLLNFISLLILVPGLMLPNLMCKNGNDSDILPFCIRDDYKKNLPPVIDEKPLDVSIIVMFDDIVEINDESYEVTFNVVLEISWIEPRLVVLNNSTNWNGGSSHIKSTSQSPKLLEYIWKPDIDIPNLKKFHIKKVFDRQGQINIYNNKRISYDFPVQITLNCPEFNFVNFPFDTVFCNFFIGSYEWSRNHVLYNGVVRYNESRQRPLQYHVHYIKALSFEEGIRQETYLYHTPNGSKQSTTEEYSHFAMKMEFKRRILGYAFSIFLPSFLIVLSSWLGFLIGTASIPGRLTVTVVLLLVLINMR